ncbi:MAG: hypothetical protein OEV42_16835 [Deltaproteobacteria bacterium]|nr:hypothetical protein [Deltaproteobacteria bacterium]
MIEKKVIIKPLKKDDRDDLRFWLSKSVEERLSAVELLRQDYYGADYADKSGFPRVYKIVKLKQG